MRFLLLLIVAFIALLLINRALGNARRAVQQRENEHRANNTKAIGMVQCAHCGIHVPENEAVHYQNKSWCSLAHAKTADKV